MNTKPCKYCGVAIMFEQRDDGRWFTVDPGNGRKHVCQLEQVCQSCKKPFQGAPWMKQCRECWSLTQPNRQGFANRAQQQQQQKQQQRTRMEKPATVPRETLNDQDDFFDDIPF